MSARRWFALSILLLCATAVSSCRKEQTGSPGPATQPAPPQQELNIAAAADLKFALDEAAATFRQAHTDIDVRITYGSSGNFFAQLSNKAPFDLFFSADIAYPRKLIEHGLANEQSEFIYAIGRIVLWVPNSSALDISKLGLDALTDPSMKKIAIANPQHAPYGRAAEAALRKRRLWEKVQGKLVLGENIAQTAQFVESGSADAGIIALSLALSPQMKINGRFWMVPQEDYPKIEQAGVVLSYASHPQAAELFRQFITSADGRAILDRFGLEAPAQPQASP